MSTQNKITIIGGGAFGTAMAHLLSQKGLDVCLWAKEKDVVDDINNNHKNSLFFDEGPLNFFNATNNVKKAVQNRDILVFAIPCQFLRPFLQQNKTHLDSQALLVNLAKGIDVKSLETPSQIFASELGEEILNRFASLSGPTFAKELYHTVPSGAALACMNQKNALLIQEALSQRFFRLYTVDDLIGVELGGALKNVMALGVGIADGLGFGLNTQAGLITRCLHEMTKLGHVLGAKTRTFSGLSGMGDLILTCTGHLSRNRQVGVRIGKGESPDDVIKSLKHVAEGVATAKAVHTLKEKHGVDMPNSEQVYKILYENTSPKQAMDNLLSRKLKDEFS